MINLVEHCKENRDQIVRAHCVGSYETPNDGKKLTAIEALVEVFLVRLEAAKKSEEQADALLTSPEEKKEAESKKDGKENNASSLPQALPAEDLEETLMKALQKAGKNMEHSVIGSYIALLLGCVIQNNQEYANLLKEKMPERKFDVMVEVLKKFLNFVSLTGVVGTTGITSIQRVVEVLESS
ncbi:wings apart-like protein homolog [Centruroides sculpturatus]|nr:wings apart-like protein homolog [Centruroides sculpturatus]